MAPPHGAFERVRLDELLHFIASELHKGFAPWTLVPHRGEDSLGWCKARLGHRVEVLGGQLADRQFLFGDSFTIVDAYAFWALRAYSFLTRVKLEGALKEYLARMTAWPSIKEAVDVEKRGG